MFHSDSSSISVNWRTIDNCLNRLSVGEKPRRRVKRRTRILNQELKKFASLKSYSQYVKIKTRILRDVSDGDVTDNEFHGISSSESEESLSEELPKGEKRKRSRNLSKKRDDKKDGKIERDNKNKENARRSGRARVKKNLTPLLDDLETKDDVEKNNRPDEDAGEKNGEINYEAEASRDEIEGETIVERGNGPTGDSGIDDDSQDNSSNNNLENEETIRKENQAVKGEENNLEEAIGEREEKKEESKKKSQPVITRMEIVKSKYTIIRDQFQEEEEKEEYSNRLSPDPEILQTDQGPSSFEITSPESKRVSQLKRINLLCSGSESDVSEDNEIDDTVETAFNAPTNSQFINSFSDSDDLSTSSSFRISNSDDSDGENILENDYSKDETISSNIERTTPKKKSIKDQIQEQDKTFMEESSQQSDDTILVKKSIKEQIQEQENNLLSANNNEENDSDSDQHFEREEAMQKISPPETGSPELAKKSIKDQIKEQENNLLSANNNNDNDSDSNQYFDREEAMQKISSPETGSPKFAKKSIKDQIKEQENGISENLQHFENISRERFHDDDSQTFADNSQDEDTSEFANDDEENLSRPFELCDFVAREGLLPAPQLSTLTIKDLSINSAKEDNEEEILLMEIPKSIIDRQICGKRMLIENGIMKIDDAIYKTTLRHDNLVSCVLRSKRKKPRYKTVNLRTTRSLIVRQQPEEDEELLAVEAPEAEKSVPFPKNVKLRDPLTMGTESTSLFSRDSVNDDAKQSLQKRKKKRAGFWHIDHFILKSKKKRIYFP